MKSPVEYLDDAWQPYPEEWPASGVPFVPMAQALAAVMLALSDAERYKTNLVGAVLRAHPSTPQPAESAIPSDEL